MIKHLNLTNWRNWPKFSESFGRNNFLLGPNGSGKTNILEAIYYLKHINSWKPQNGFDQVKAWEQDYLQISADISTQQEDYQLHFFQGYQEDRKVRQLKIGGRKCAFKELNRIISVLLFSPEQIDLLQTPAGRRKYLNDFLLNSDHHYRTTLRTYQKILIAKNRLLSKIKEGLGSKSELLFWNNSLVEEGHRLINWRRQWFVYAGEQIVSEHSSLVKAQERVSIEYRPAVRDGELGEKIAQNTDREIAAGISLYGPHRDDWMITLNGHDITVGASRGQWRTILAALKVVETNYLAKSGQKPIILLDDILSELDEARKASLLHKWRDHQKIISTAEALPSDIDISDWQIISVGK